MEKIAVVIHGMPHINEGASSVVFYWYIKGLLEAGYDVNCITIVKKPVDTKVLEKLYMTLEKSGKIKIQTVICDEPITYSSIFGPKEINTELTNSMLNLLNDYSPSKILCFDIIPAWSAKLYQTAEKIVWLGDLNFETYWYHIFYSLERGDYRNALENLLYFYPWKKCYIKALEGCSKIVVCSKSSEKQIKKLRIDSEYLPYPWPVNKVIRRETNKVPTIAFFGSLAGLGSLSAVTMLVKEIHPKLNKIYGARGFIIKIFGKDKFPSFAEEIINRNKEFEMLGYVNNLEEQLAQCHALMAPIKVPVGNRTRIITALSHELPVIARQYSLRKSRTNKWRKLLIGIYS